MYLKVFIFLLFIGCTSVTKRSFPHHWWQEVSKEDLKWWEVSPRTAGSDEVILSKRNELGILSNFAATPFELDGKHYATVEAFWQSLKYPESKKDIRAKVKGWPYSRAQVEQLDGFAAKKAGDFGSKVMQMLKLDWVSYQGKKLIYRTSSKGEHYQLILRAMRAKLKQNPEVAKVLISTQDLKLRPDHQVGENDPPAWRYYDIWMEIREELLKKN